MFCSLVNSFVQKQLLIELQNSCVDMSFGKLKNTAPATQLADSF